MCCLKCISTSVSKTVFDSVKFLMSKDLYRQLEVTNVLRKMEKGKT